jgi:hypothetical protein
MIKWNQERGMQNILGIDRVMDVALLRRIRKSFLQQRFGMGLHGVV